MAYHHYDHVFTKRGVLTGVFAYLLLAFVVALPFFL